MRKGIHGDPNIPWDGVNGSGGAVGYCAHNTVLFPTWQRPYMALIEVRPLLFFSVEMIWQGLPQQIISQNAQNIAQTYPDSSIDEYVAAAQTLRLPYWDWTMDADIPAIANVSTIQINTPNGPQTIDNPLYHYAFPPLAAQLGLVSLIMP